MNDADRAAFESWFEQSEPRLRAALVASFGADVGRDAAEALSYAWEHRARVLELDNPVGYVFRVGQRWARRHQQRARRRVGFASDEVRPPRTTPSEVSDACRKVSAHDHTRITTPRAH